MQSQKETDWGKRLAQGLPKMKKERREERGKKFKKLLAEIKKTSHLCSPETDGFNLEAQGLQDIENQQKARKGEIKNFKKKLAEKQKDSHLCSPKQKGSLKRNAESEKQ